MVRSFVRSFGPELLPFNKIIPALVCANIVLNNVAELVSIVNKSIGPRHVFLANIFWYAN